MLKILVSYMLCLVHILCLLLLCSDGIGRSGTFCALIVSMNQFKAEQKVDIFQTIKIMRTQRPGSVANAVS